MFEGEYESYIQCIEVDYTSTTRQVFKDLTLNLITPDRKPIKSFRDALNNWQMPEVLDDLYQTDDPDKGVINHGKQKAKKGLRLTKLPAVFSAHFLRFDFDMELLDFNKLNHEVTFEQDIDMAEYLPRDYKDETKYKLFGVTIHTGSYGSGHYY